MIGRGSQVALLPQAVRPRAESSAKRCSSWESAKRSSVLRILGFRRLGSVITAALGYLLLFRPIVQAEALLINNGVSGTWHP